MNFLEDIEGLVSNKIEVFKTLIAIIKLETRLASLSVMPLLLNLCFLFVVGITGWGALMVMLAYGLTSFFSNFFLGTLSVCILNTLLVFGLLKYLLFNLKSMSFENTRAYFNRKGASHVYAKTTSDRKLKSIRKKTALPSTKCKKV